MKKLFTNDKFFLAMVIFGFIGAFLCALLYCIPALISFDPATSFLLLFEAVCVISLYLSYKNHSKNVMKGMIAALLTAILLESTCWLNSGFSPDTVFGCISILLNGILFANHFIINCEHHSKPVNIRINQVIVLLDCVVYIVWDVVWALSCPLGVNTIGAILACIGCIGNLAIIVCVESRLDAYRLDREAAGWTEEKGYPDGYIHEYEKK